MKMKQLTVKKVVILCVLLSSVLAPVVLTGCGSPGTVNVEIKKV